MVDKDRKKDYEKPRLVEYGSVSDVTRELGGTFLTDADLTGSMAFPGMGMSGG